MRPLRILHVTQPTTAGVAQVVADLTRAQQAAGHLVVVACPEDARFAGRLADAGVSGARWAATRVPGPASAAQAHALRRIVTDVRPDLVHLHSSTAGLAGRLAVRGRIATVFQPHAWSFEAVGGRLGAATVGWERLAARWADRVLCVSQAEREVGAAHGIKARYAVVPNGVDTVRFQACSRPDARASAPVCAMVPPLGPLVVCVGRLCRQKGQDVLLEAWPEVLRRVDGARLALVGDGPQAAVLARRLADDPRLADVYMAGGTDDPRPWYHAADLVVLPSRWEAMALVPLEASACARVVVASDVVGVRESLPPEHVAWALSAPGDPHSLAEALVAALGRLAAHPADRMRMERAAARYARDHHDVARTAAQVSDLYHAILREREAARAPRSRCVSQPSAGIRP